MRSFFLAAFSSSECTSTLFDHVIAFNFYYNLAVLYVLSSVFYFLKKYLLITALLLKRQPCIGKGIIITIT